MVNPLRHQRDIFHAQAQYRFEGDPDRKRVQWWMAFRRHWNAWRTWVQAALLSVYFEVLILVTTVTTFFAVGWTIPQYDGLPAHNICSIILAVCNGVYTIEVVLKMCAWGLWHYRDPKLPRDPFFRVWQNVLDLALCIAQWVERSSGFFASLRILKFFHIGEGGTLIRPMRKVRMLSVVLAESVLPGLFLVLILFLQCMWWGLPGIWLFAGRFHARCYPTNTTDCCMGPYNLTEMCWPPDIFMPCATEAVLGSTGSVCPYDHTTCEVRPCFRETLLNYDNVINALIMNLGLVTASEGWLFTVEAAYAAGANMWWYFAGTFVISTYVVLMARIIVLYHYSVVQRQRKKRPRQLTEMAEPFLAERGTNKFRSALRSFIEEKFFAYMMLLVTVVDVIALSFYWYGIPSGLMAVGTITDLVCSLFFLIEFLLKVVAYGFRGYFHSAMNCLDFFLVIIIIVSYVEAFLVVLDVLSSESELANLADALKTIRVVRFLRVFPLLPLNARSAAMSNAFLTCVPKYLLLEVVHFIFIWLFAIVGCNIFHGLVGGTPAQNVSGMRHYLGYSFAGLQEGLITTYAISTADNWPTIMQYIDRRTDDAWLLFQSTAYLLCVIVIGSYLIPALFLAVQVTHFRSAMEAVITESTATNEYPSTDDRSKVISMLLARNWHLPWDPEEEDKQQAAVRYGYDALGEDLPEAGVTETRKLRYPAFFTSVQKLGLHMPYLVDTMPPQARAKIWLAKVVIHRYAVRVQCVVIFCHCVTIALISDRAPSGLKSLTDALQIVFVGVALLELLLKLYVYGPRMYLRCAFNVLDVVAFGGACIGLARQSFSSVVMLRMLHILRTTVRSTRMQNIFHGTAKVFPTLLTAFSMLVLLIFCFTLMGINLFAGRYWNCWQCLRPSGTVRVDWSLCLVVSNLTHFCTQADCEASPTPPNTQRFWMTTTTNYDNLLWASLSSVRIALQADWSEVMYAGISTQPQMERCLVENYRQGYFAYFVFFIAVCVLVGLSWFVGVTSYMMSTSHLTVPVFEALQKEQQDWLDLILNIVVSHGSHPPMVSRLHIPDKSEGPQWRRRNLIMRVRALHFINRRAYAVAVFLVEATLFGVLCTMHLGQTQFFADLQRVVGLLALIVFAVDVAVKMWVYEVRPYFCVGIFLFEFTTFVFSVLVYALEGVGILEVYDGGYPYAFVRLVRMPQLLNLLLILFTRRERTRGLWFYEIRTHYLVSAIWFVIYRIMPVMLIWLVVVAFQAVVAVQFFQNMQVKLVDGIVITDYYNFQTWPQAFLGVLRMSHGSYWVALLDQIRLREPFCEPSTCVFPGAVGFVAIPAIIGFVFASVLGSIVVDFVTFEDLRNRVDMQLLQTYNRLWAHIDRGRTGAIAAHEFCILWRHVAAHRLGGWGEVLHAGLAEWRSNPLNAGQVREWPAFEQSLKFPVLLWPVTRKRQVPYDDGLAALSAAIVEIGYMEARLLLRLINPQTVIPDHRFWTVTHCILARRLESNWTPFLQRLTRLYQQRYDFVIAKSRQQPVAWEDGPLQFSDPEPAGCGKTPCPSARDSRDFDDPFLPPARSDAPRSPTLGALLQSRAARRSRFQTLANEIKTRADPGDGASSDGDDSAPLVDAASLGSPSPVSHRGPGSPG